MSLKNILTVTLLTWVNINLNAQSSCGDFAVGKFQNVESGVIRSSIERNDSIQIEEYGAQKIKLRIEWIDSCAYRLIFLEGNDAWWASRGRDRPTPDLIVKITEIQGNSYWQLSKFVDDKVFGFRSRIEKIK